MTHEEALALLRPTKITPGGTWADLGAGTGTFTKALAELVGVNGIIHAVDKDNYALRQLAQSNPSIITHQQDFTASLGLENLAGILIANALHFVRHQEKVLGQLSSYLNSGGKFIIIEYNISRANPWVPFPVSFERLKELASRSEFNEPMLVARKDSRYHREMYVAVLTLKS
jgi:ubiquinone/menaquinone biosynthesis C-methylase UbiE